MSSLDWSTIAQIVTLVIGVTGLGSVARLRANARLADERADNLERMLKIERADRLEAEARCNGRVAESDTRRENDRRVAELKITKLEGRVAALTGDMGKVIADAVVHALRVDGSA